MKAMALVAHPDDCVIFAKPFIDNFPNWTWYIVYLTYHANDRRAQEIGRYWQQRGVGTHFLGFVDSHVDLALNRLTRWTQLEASEKIRTAVDRLGARLLLTHNQAGEYGHIHHKTLHQIALDITDTAKVYFADHINYNIEYHAKDSVDLDQLPLHRSVISGFVTRDHGRYTLTDEAKEIINENSNT